MSKPKCFFDGCLFEPVGICKCSDSSYYLCPNHIVDHIKVKTPRGHNYVDSFSIPNNVSIPKIIQNSIYLLQKLNEAKLGLIKKSIEDIKKIKETAKKGLDELNKLVSLTSELIKVPKSFSELTNISHMGIIQDIYYSDFDFVDNLDVPKS